MVKPSRRPIMDESSDKPLAIVERIKELRAKPQTEKIQQEIQRLIKEWQKTLPAFQKKKEYNITFKKMKIKSAVVMSLAVAAMLTLTGCSDANIASRNLSKAADQFEINRRVVFYNGITGEYMLEIRGYCSLGNYDGPQKVSITCKVGEGEYKKHFLGLSDNVTYFAEQLESKGVSKDQYRVIFKPSSIIPDIDMQ